MSELVERTDVPPATIRYYLSSGLLPPPVKVAANRFLYDERHVELVRFVRLLRERRHLSLEAIGEILPDLLPDLLGRPKSTGVFRPEMWGRLLASSNEAQAGELVAARVLQSAVAAFSQHGYSEVTVDDVCRAAGIAKGSFYRHFASKEDLFFAAARAAGATVAARLAATVAGAQAIGEWDEVVLAESVAPEVGILLDLASLAARQRTGASEVLAEVVGGLERELGSGLGAGGERAGARVVSLVLGTALRRLAAIPAGHAPVESP